MNQALFLCFAAILLAFSSAAGADTNLVANGGFEKAEPGRADQPAAWDRLDGLGVQWVEAPEEPGAESHGHAIRLDTAVSEKAMVEQWRRVGIRDWDIPNPANDPVAATYGLSFYSAAMPVVSGQAYRVTFDFKGASGGGKLWVRGWGQFQGERRRRYETIVFCRVPDKNWHAFSQVFHPTRLRPEVTEMKVMLYAYWPPGAYWFDNVRIEPVTPAEYERERRQPEGSK